MQENTEGFNENSNSEVIILPPNSHLEETLVSDDDETDNETPHSYDAKLNAKLKELGLYEDGMTIQQKEELLAVVAVSFKTAEEEKTRRRWYEEYSNAPLSFPEDEIEFNFQHSPELELSTKESCYSGDYNTNSVKSEGSSICEIDGSIASTSSGITSGDNCCHMQNEFQHLLSNAHSTDFKTKSQPRKNRSRAISNKLALQEGNTVTSHSPVSVLDHQDIQLTNKQKKHLLEKSMSTWRPCLSPKDEPLICSRRQFSEELEEPYSEEKCNQKMLECIQDFNFALAEVKKSMKKMSPLAKPYQLSKNGYCGKKVTKLDSMDIMVGVQEGREEVLGEANASNCLILSKEPFSRTSGGASRYAKLHRERINDLKNSISPVNNYNSCIIDPSFRYGIKKISLQYVDDRCRTPEVIIEEGSDNEDISPSDGCNPIILHNSNSSRKSSCESKDKITLITKLPKFNNLRPDLCAGNFSDKEALARPIDSQYSDCSTVSSVNFSTKSSGSTVKKENHIDSSCKDGDLSDSSSVIDVETFDEMEEVVLKRKFLQEPIISERQTYSNRFKRLKKNAS